MSRDPSDALKTHLRDNVDTGNISASLSTEAIDHADYDQGPSFPSVAIVSEDPSHPNSGPEDLSGIDPSGSGATQDTLVSLLVDCWGGTHETQIYHDEGSNPTTVASELAWEVHRVCFGAQSDAPTGYNFLTAAAPRTAHDTQTSPATRRYQTVCYLRFTNRP